MDPIAALIEKLDNHSELKWAKGKDWLKIHPPHPKGFGVELRVGADEWTVYLGNGGWHQHFDDPLEALNLVAYCYSGEVRVREVYRGNVLQKSVLEGTFDGTWEKIATTAYLAPFWRRKREVILQNPALLRQ